MNMGIRGIEGEPTDTSRRDLGLGAEAGAGTLHVAAGAAVAGVEADHFHTEVVDNALSI